MYRTLDATNKESLRVRPRSVTARSRGRTTFFFCSTHSPTMDDFPLDKLLPIVAGYLPPSDALAIAGTCKKWHAAASLTAAAPREVLAEFARHHVQSRGPHRGFEIPVPAPARCHSVALSATWKGGEGRVFVVAERRGAPRPPIDGLFSSGKRFGGGRLVYASPPVPERAVRMNIAFRPDENETYHLW